MEDIETTEANARAMLAQKVIEKKRTYSDISHYFPNQDTQVERTFNLEMAPVASAIKALADKPQKEIRVNLPAMNPTFTAGAVNVTVPEIKVPEISVPAAVVTVNVPPSPPSQIVLDYKKLAYLAFAMPVVYCLLQWLSWKVLGMLPRGPLTG